MEKRGRSQISQTDGRGQDMTKRGPEKIRLAISMKKGQVKIL
jgi:hypothetical protein